MDCERPTTATPIKGLDGIRGLSAIAVVVTHLHGWDLLHGLGILPASAIPMVNGTAAVQAFFILSGFLITSLLIAEQATSGTVSLKNFFARRALRIFPLYYLFLIIATAIYLIDPRVTSPSSLLFAYAYLYNFVPASLYTSFLGHTWSLAVEEHFYLVWPVAFVLLRPWLSSGAAKVLGAAILCSPMIHLGLVRTNAFGGFFVERWSFVSGYSIAAGCLLALAFRSNTHGARLRAAMARPGSLLIGLAAYSAPAFVQGASWAFDGILSHYFRCFGLVCAIGWVVLNQASRAVASLESRPLKYCGKISYGIYIYQGLFLATGPARHEGHAWPPGQLIGLLMLLVAAPLSYHCFEKPLMRLKENFR